MTHTAPMYLQAQEKIKAGDWVVDPVAGTVTNRQGKRLGFRSPDRLRAVSHVGRPHEGEPPHSPRDLGVSPRAHRRRPADQPQERGQVGQPTCQHECVTVGENRRHARDTGLWRAVTGEQTGQAKLTAQQVRKIRERRAAGELQRVIAKDYGVCRQLIGQIDTGQIWTSV